MTPPRLRIWGLIAALVLVGGACSSAPARQPRFLDAAATEAKVEEFLTAALALAPAAGRLGGDPPRLGRGDTAKIRRIGELANEVASRVRPEDSYDALEALIRLERGFAQRAGGTKDPHGNIVVGPVIVTWGDRAEAEAYRLSVLGGPAMNFRQEDVLRQIEAQFDHLATAAILIDREARSEFAPNLAPGDLPAVLPTGPEGGEIDGALGGARIGSVEDWRRLLFDAEGRLILEDITAGYSAGALHVWAITVNPRLEAAVDSLRAAFLEGIRSYGPRPGQLPSTPYG